jgi:hypothetical protein
MISLYRDTNDKQYLKMAKKFAAKIRGWAMVDVRDHSASASTIGLGLTALPSISRLLRVF